MGNRKLKVFLKIFLLLLVIQMIIVLADVVLTNADSSLSEMTSFIISIFSFPIKLISSNLPFYSGEGIYVMVILWMLNLVLQTMIIYGCIRMIQRIK